MALAALLILALAGPVLNPAPGLGGSGPLVLAIDNGWAAAQRWDGRLQVARELVEQAAREERRVVLLPTAPTDRPFQPALLPASEAVDTLTTLTPQPWPVDRPAAERALAALSLGGATTKWLSDGLAGSPAERTAAEAFAATLRRLGPLQVYADAAPSRPALLRLPDGAGTELAVTAERVAADPAARLEVEAHGPGGETLARVPIVFDGDGRKGAAKLELPADMRNRVARLELSPAQGIGGTVLLDERWRRRTVGMIGAGRAEDDQPLLSELYFIARALGPSAELRQGGIAELTDGPLSLMVLPDAGRIDPAERARLDAWMEEGGVLLRFAGPRLAASGDDLVPVPLRAGDRMLGGALSWQEPLRLAPFDPDGPFAGLLPPEEVRVSRQVLAEPSPALSAATLATLEDGTPLITMAQRGKGRLILVHTSANTSWSTLPLSGLFVDMLQRILALAPGAGGTPRGALEPHRVLDAFGRLSDFEGALPPIPADRFATTVAGPAQPPGLYGPVRVGEAAEEEPARLALNLQPAVRELLPLGDELFGGEPVGYARAEEVDLAPSLLTLALLLALADLVIGYFLRGLVPQLGRVAAAAVALLLWLPTAQAQEGEDRLVELANETRLAYVVTGDAAVDQESEAGLRGLTRVLAQRTAVEAADPAPVDVASAELALFPLLYWPVPPDHANLAAETVERVERYLQQGGMILFDTRDGANLLPGQDGGGPGEARLGQLLEGLDLPPLQPVPPDHVLTRSFYLLQDFPGRWAGQTVWVDQAAPGINDGVSSVIIGAHEWAGAWAEDEYGEALYPVVPGGEAQREMARRFGVNLVMYALTGNYKTDQVHVPALLERLGQ